MTDDAALSHRLEDGTIITPLRRTGERVVFSIPASARFLRICSRVARPSATVGPFVDDRRDLGVQVAATRWTAKGRQGVDFTGPTLGGWYPAEGGLRWTRGQVVGELSRAGSTVLVLRIVAAGPYLAVALAA